MNTDKDILGLENLRDSTTGHKALEEAFDLLSKLSTDDYWKDVQNLANTLDSINSRAIVAEFHLHPIVENSDWLANHVLLEESTKVIDELNNTSKALRNLLSTMEKVQAAKKELDSPI